MLPNATEDTEQILLALSIRNRRVTTAMPAALTPNGVLLLPFRQFCSLLGIRAIVNSATARAEFSKPLRQFSYSLDTTGLSINDTPFVAEASELQTIEGELYVSIRVLDFWLQAKSEFSYAKLELRLTPGMRLPIEDIWQAESSANRRPDLTARQDRPPAGISAETPSLFSFPSLDFSMTTSRQPTRVAGSNLGLTQNVNMFGSGDLLFMNAQWNASGDLSNPFQKVRFQMGRTSPLPNLLGSLRARKFEFGDIWFPQTPLISNVQQGRGFEISSFPVYHSADTNTTIVGNGLAGWNVELYRDGLLIDVVAVEQDGSYRFNNVSLVMGNNQLKTVSVGPNGETRIETKNYYVGPGATGAGETNYRFIAMQESDNDSFGNGKTRWLAEMEHGLTSTSSLVARIAQVPFNGDDQSYSSIGLRQAFGDSYGTLEFLRSNGGGWGVAAGLQTRIRNSNLSLSIAKFGGGYDGEALVSHGDSPLTFQAAARLDSMFYLTPGLPLAYSVTLKISEDERGRTQFQLSSRFAGLFKGLQFNNSISMSRTYDYEDTQHGVFSIKRRIGSQWYRGEVGYSLSNPSIKSLSIGVELGRTTPLRSHIGIRQEFSSQNNLVAFASFYRKSMAGNFGLDLQLNQDGELTAGLMFSVGLGSEPRSGKLMIAPSGIASSGTVSARAYLDANASGKFDKGDVALAGVRFIAGRRRLEGITDSNGVVLLSGLTPNVPIQISVDPDSLEDPTLSIALEANWIVPRLGGATLAEFPLVHFGAVDGTVAYAKGGQINPLSGITIRLLDANGGRKYETVAAYDGRYIFENVLPGKYVVLVLLSEADAARFSGNASAIVDVFADGSPLTGVNFLLTERDIGEPGEVKISK